MKLWYLSAVAQSALVAAKLAGVLTWSWWAITCPTWGGFALLGFCLCVVYGWRTP